MTRQTKIILLITGAFLLIVCSAAVVCYSLYAGTANNIVLQVKALDTFDIKATQKAEAQKLGFSEMPDYPNLRASQISAEIQASAKARVNRQFSPDRVKRRIEADIANLKLAKRGDKIDIKLKSGQPLTGTLRRIVADAQEGAMITVDTRQVKVRSEVVPEDQYRFSKTLFERHKLMVSAKYRSQYEADKEKFLDTLINQMEADRMPKELYCREGRDWMPAAEIVKRETERRRKAFVKDYDEKVQKILDENTVFGIKFTREDLKLPKSS